MQTEVLIAGDVWPARCGAHDLRERLQISTSPDLFVFTLDAAVAAGPPRANYTCIDFDPVALDELKIGRTNLAVTASNHITDFGDAGLMAALRELEARGFSHLGSGINRAAAERKAIVDLPAGKVAVLAFAETAPRVKAIAAEHNSAGVRPLEASSALAAIAAAKQETPWVWVVLHWGDEFIRYPDPAQRKLARAMIDAGADLVVASHTHVPLGYEAYGSGMIFFGLGNFMFPPYTEKRGFQYRWIPASRQGVIARGQYDGHSWHWTAEEIRHDPQGIPRLAKHPNCPDYGRTLAADLDQYAALYPGLRSRERLTFFAQRLMTMSWRERWVRLKGLQAKRS